MACHARTLPNDTVARSVAGTPALEEVARIEEFDRRIVVTVARQCGRGLPAPV